MRVQLLTREELAVKLGIPRDCVGRLVKNGELPCVRLGECMSRFHQSDVERYLEGNEKPEGI